MWLINYIHDWWKLQFKVLIYHTASKNLTHHSWLDCKNLKLHTTVHSTRVPHNQCWAMGSPQHVCCRASKGEGVGQCRLLYENTIWDFWSAQFVCTLQIRCAGWLWTMLCKTVVSCCKLSVIILIYSDKKTLASFSYKMALARQVSTSCIS